MVAVLCAAAGLMVLLMAAWVMGGRVAAPASAEELVDDQTTEGRIPVEDLDGLAQLGWNVAQIGQHGRGLVPESAETHVDDGIRTVTVRFTEGDRRLVVAESRPEDAEAELPTSQERLAGGGLLDDGSAPQRRSDSTQPMVLTGGESAQMHHVPGESTWSAVVGDEDVQYLITSDADPAEARPIASWVMLADRSRVTGTPDGPSGVERIEEGLEKLLSRLL